MKPKKVNRKGNATAKLTIYDWGWRDNIIYAVTAKANEKLKGLAMLEKLRNLFGVNDIDEKQFRDKMTEMQRKAFTPEERKPIRWTRNEKGQIVSPFDKKIKKTHLASSIPGHMKPCSDVNNAARYDEPPTLSTEDYKEEETSVNDHREITGSTSSLLPAENPRNQPDTLGGMQLVIGQSAQRLKPDLLMMEAMGIRKMANRGFS